MASSITSAASPQNEGNHSNKPESAETSNPHGASTGSDAPSTQAVRFSSINQEIEPIHSLQVVPSTTTETSIQEELSPEAQAELRNLSHTLQNSHLQQRRMSNFAFEPVSLPASRVPSNEPTPTTREGSRSIRRSPGLSPARNAMQTPPLSPSGPSPREAAEDAGQQAGGAGLAKVHPDPARMTPQVSAPKEDSSNTFESTSRPPSGSEQASTRDTSGSQDSSSVLEMPPQRIPWGRDGSVPASREGSPSRIPGGGSGAATPPTAHSRPFTPSGDRDDPYARSKRPPQSRNLDAIDARFVFESKDSRRRSAYHSNPSSSTNLPRSNSGGEIKAPAHDKSTFSLHSLGGKKDHLGHLNDESSTSLGAKPHGSMSDLKRFFRIGHSKDRRSHSPMKSLNDKSGARTPPHQLPHSNVPFADDHGLETRYGKFGKVLGSGAGGSVRLLKRSSDGVTFAVKQFRDRHNYETEREYAKKVTAEFCIGSTLHHGNIIETLDIVHEKGKWYEVMEFAPFDLFAIVMTGKMSREEVACSFLQILSGVVYLHSMGLAHRDLKLDNVVVNEHGIMKLIDFGSAAVFKYPFENDIVLATGVVGSDPYLAPEVYDNAKYDPQGVDIWSLAIIFACMSLRRFPWKAPRLTDNSYKLFVSQPQPGTPSAADIHRPKSSAGLPDGEESRRQSAPDTKATALDAPAEEDHHHHHHHHQHHSDRSNSHGNAADVQPISQAPRPRIDAPKQSEVIKGPWRLLRLLPREVRSVIGAMLEVDPKKRATMDEIMADPWMSATPVCKQIEGGKVVRAPGHTHTLEPGSPAAPEKGKP